MRDQPWHSNVVTSARLSADRARSLRTLTGLAWLILARIDLAMTGRLWCRWHACLFRAASIRRQGAVGDSGADDVSGPTEATGPPEPTGVEAAGMTVAGADASESGGIVGPKVHEGAASSDPLQPASTAVASAAPIASLANENVEIVRRWCMP